MPIVQHSLVNTKKHIMMSVTHPHHNHTTHVLRGWSKFTFTQSTTFHTLTASPPARLCPPFHLGPPNRTGRPLPGQRGRGGRARAHAAWLRSKVAPRAGTLTSTSTGPTRQAQLQKARPNLSDQSQHQLISAHMHCTPTTKHAHTSY